MGKLAVILMNLGGPDSLENVRPFLFNLFNDKAIIGAPLPIRWLLAKRISSKRAPEAREIYKQIGGSSPLLELTQKQADALQENLQKSLVKKEIDVKVFIAMRYWHPLTEDVVKEVKNWGADHVILLPLYPQFSTATSGSSINAWKRAACGAAMPLHTQAICCYPANKGFVKAQAKLIAQKLSESSTGAPLRLLFSAHGLPQKLVDRGDPYQTHVEESAAAIVEELKNAQIMERFCDWRISYQSRVGPMEWLKPYTDKEIEQAGSEKTGILLVPIAFVSEHSETLVELDIEYRDLALKSGVSEYLRAPAVGDHPDFIDGLADLVQKALWNKDAMQGHCGAHTPNSGSGSICGLSQKECPRRIMGYSEPTPKHP